MSKKIMILFFLFLLMIPLLCFSQTAKKPTPKVSFDYIDADVRNVIRSLSEISGKNVVISDGVKGKVTMKLEDVYWDEALEIVASTSGLKKYEADNIIRVMTAKEFDDERKSKDTERDAFRKEKLERQKLGEEFMTETIYINYANPADVEKMLRSGGAAGAAGTAGAGRGFLSEFGTITQVTWTNAIIIRDTKENIANIVKIVKEHDKKPHQIQIDCKIVQATSNFSKELGIQWGASIDSQNSKMMGNKALTLTGSQLLPAAIGLGSGGSLGVLIGSAADSTLLDIQLSALEAEGKGRVLSNPKVVASDTKKAIIQQGKSIPYKTVSQTGTQTQFAEAVLGLEVTPTVINDGYIKLEILAKKDQADFINQSEGVPTIDKKQATTLLYVRDGETAVIGGIYERAENDGESGLPGLRNIPLLGWLFKKTTNSDAKTELLIFITPRILKNTYKDEG
jgi:type IV pilus assembly protein PilQ